MAYGQFTGYEPDPTVPGAYNFQTAGGQPLLFSGPEAEQLKARIDASNATNLVAGPGGGGETDMQRFQAANRAAAEEANRAAAAGIVPTAQDPQAAAPNEQDAGGGYEPVRIGSSNVAGLRRGPGGVLQEYRGGSAGVSKEQLERSAGQAVETPSSTQETVAGGFAPDEAFLEARRERETDKRLLLNRQRDQVLAEQEAVGQLEREQFAKQATQMAEQQKRAQDIQARVEGDQKRRDDALNEYKSAKVDPERIFSGDTGGLRAVVAAISSALGAYASTIGKTRNYAQEILDNAIDRDIRAQEAEIQVKGESADNALADLQRSGMEAEQARNTLESIQRDYAKSQIAQARAASANEKINAQFDQLDLGLQEQLANADEAYRQDSIGRATKTVASQYAYPRAGSAGGWAPVSVDRALKLEEKAGDIEGKTAGTAKTISEIGPDGKPLTPQAQAQGARADAAIASIDRSLKALEKYDSEEVPDLPENQGVVRRVWNAGEDLVMGAGENARTDLDARDRALIQDTEVARGEIRALTSVLSEQGALSGPEAEAANKGMAPGSTVGDVQRALAIVRDRASAIQQRVGSKAKK